MDIMKNVLIIGASLVLLGIMFVVGGYMLAGRKLSGFNSKNNDFVKRTYECTGDIDNIRVVEKSDHLTVRSDDVDKVTVTCYDNKDNGLYDIEEKDGVLDVIRNEKRGFHFFDIDFTDKSTVITVPRDFEGGLDLKTSSGGVELSDLTGKEIAIENTSGSIKIDNTKGDSLSVKNTSGGIRLANVTMGSDIAVGNTSGSIKFENVTAGGDLSAKGSSGGIKLDNIYADGNINIDNTSGSIRGTIKGKQSDYRIRAQVTSGSCNLTDSDEGSRELNVKTTSGGIKIEFTE